MIARVFLWLLVMTIVPSAHAADTTDHKAVLRGILQAESFPNELFTRGQRRSVSPKRLARQVAAVRKDLGEVLQITGGHGSYSAWTRDRRVPVRLSIQADGKISRLRIRKSRKFPTDLEGALKGLQKLPGWVSVLVQKNGADVFEQNAGELLSVGSAFKLAVLVALSAKVKSGEADWSTGLEVRDEHRTLNSPVVQRMPAGSVMTVHTLAVLMMALDDHAATDILMEFVGRDAVGIVMGSKPVPSTLEYAKLRSETELADGYGASDAAGRMDILDSLEEIPVPPAQTALLPSDRKINWLISSRRFCEMMQFVKDLTVFPNDHGLAVPSVWKRAALSAGGAAGGLSWTIWLEGSDKAEYCVSLTWNRGDGVDESALSDLLVPLIRSLSNPVDQAAQTASTKQTASQ